MAAGETPARGLDETARKLLGAKSARDLTSFLLRRRRENQAFRRSVNAWLIDAHADELAPDAVRAEIQSGIDDAPGPGNFLTPRVPDLRALGSVRTAARHHPELTVFAHMTVVDGIASWLQTYGEGPESFHTTMMRHYGWAVAAVPAIPDEERRLACLEEAEPFALRAGDFGYGIAGAAAEALATIAGRFPGRTFDRRSIWERRQACGRRPS